MPLDMLLVWRKQPVTLDETLDIFLSLHPNVSDNQPAQVLFAFKTWMYHWDGQVPESIEYKREIQLELDI
jgi:hypothetical protein